MDLVRRLELIDRLAGVELEVGAYAGIDEVGVDSLAGPMVAAVVILPKAHGLARLPIDSKKLFDTSVRSLAASVSAAVRFAWIGAVDAGTVDTLGVHKARTALWQAAVAAVRAVAPDVPIIIDGGEPIPGVDNQTAIPRADGTHDAVSAAAIIAKARCDHALVALDAKHPGYGLARHKGYRTKDHLVALQRLGPSDGHRRRITEKAIAKGVPKEELDLPLDELQRLVREVSELMLSHPELGDEFARRFMDGMRSAVLDRGRVPSARQQFFLVRTHRQITKEARRAARSSKSEPTDGE